MKVIILKILNIIKIQIPFQQFAQQLEYTPNNKYMNIPNQEWRNNTRNGLSSSKRQIRDEILNGHYEGHDAQKVLDANNYYKN